MSLGSGSIDPIAESCDQAEASEKVAGGFVISGCDGAKVLQATEGALDDVAKPIERLVERKVTLTGGFVGDDRRRAAVIEEGAQMIEAVRKPREFLQTIAQSEIFRDFFAFKRSEGSM